MKKRTHYIVGVILVIITLIYACKEKNSANDHVNDPKPDPTKSSLEVNTGSRYVPGDTVVVKLKLSDSKREIDSVQFEINGVMQGTHLSLDDDFTWQTTKDEKLGRKELKFRVFYKGGEKEIKKETVVLLSDVKPQNLMYKVVNEYPHNRKSYTQGLEFKDGFLYESTGQYEESYIKRVDINTGKAKFERPLDDNIFGEGMTIVGDQIIQLTWKHKKGFVYNKNNLQLIKEFYYPREIEGWGLAYDGEKLIMSDGTNKLYFLDPENFSEVGIVEVYDNNGPVAKLNELEYINGKLYANVYTTEKIVVIDPKTGKVEARLNLEGLLKEADIDINTDVLNGIAYNSEKQTFYVTGKYWPKLFEITISPVPDLIN